MKTCKQCNSQFQVTAEDLAFYNKVSSVFNSKKYQITEPTFCPTCRQVNRAVFRNERNFYHRKCNKCQIDIKTTYSSDRPEKVYCEHCYLENIY